MHYNMGGKSDQPWGVREKSGKALQGLGTRTGRGRGDTEFGKGLFWILTLTRLVITDKFQSLRAYFLIFK